MTNSKEWIELCRAVEAEKRNRIISTGIEYAEWSNTYSPESAEKREALEELWQ